MVSPRRAERRAGAQTVRLAGFCWRLGVPSRNPRTIAIAGASCRAACVRPRPDRPVPDHPLDVPASAYTCVPSWCALLSPAARAFDGPNPGVFVCASYDEHRIALPRVDARGWNFRSQHFSKIPGPWKSIAFSGAGGSRGTSPANSPVIVGVGKKRCNRL